MDLVEKVRNKVRLTQEEGEALYDLDLYTLGELADNIRKEKYGNKVLLQYQSAHQSDKCLCRCL